MKSQTTQLGVDVTPSVLVPWSPPILAAILQPMRPLPPTSPLPCSAFAAALLLAASVVLVLPERAAAVTASTSPTHDCHRCRPVSALTPAFASPRSLPATEPTALSSSPSPLSFLFGEKKRGERDDEQGQGQGRGRGESGQSPPVLVLGGTGFLGREIVRQLAEERCVPCIATSLSGRCGTVALDATADDAEEAIVRLAMGGGARGERDGAAQRGGEGGLGGLRGGRANAMPPVSAIISAVGSVTGTAYDRVANASDGKAAAAARRVGKRRGERGGTACRFVSIGASPVAIQRLGASKRWAHYLAGKAEAEDRIFSEFGVVAAAATTPATPPESITTTAKPATTPTPKARSSLCTIIKPTFIYGGDDFSLDPPRLPQAIGAVADEVLGLYPLRAMAESLPDAGALGLIGLALEPPVSVECVARAAINAALGLCDDRSELATKDDIVLVASRRWRSPLAGRSAGKREEARRRKDTLKRRIVRSTIEHVPQELVIADMDELEYYRDASIRPAYTDRLNGRWKFVFTVEPDMGTGFIKKLIERQSPLRVLLDLRGVCMEITDQQSTIRLNVDVRVLGLDIDLVLVTSLKPDETVPDGTMFYERFEGVRMLGVEFPIPDSWKQSRYLEIPYLDDDLLIARGAGREPHFLLREGAPASQ